MQIHILHNILILLGGEPGKSKAASRSVRDQLPEVCLVECNTKRAETPEPFRFERSLSSLS